MYLYSCGPTQRKCAEAVCCDVPSRCSCFIVHRWVILPEREESSTPLVCRVVVLGWARALMILGVQRMMDCLVDRLRDSEKQLAGQKWMACGS